MTPGAAELGRILVDAHHVMDMRGTPPAAPRQPWEEWVTARTVPAVIPHAGPRPYTYLTSKGRADAIRRAGAGETYSAIGRSLGVSHSTIRRAVLGIHQGAIA